jgi:hypothetical protein
MAWSGEEIASEDEARKEDRYNKLYLLIIERYKEYIEQKEGLSVAELPTLVAPGGELVSKKVNEIKASFGNYSYDSNFYDASVMSFHFVRDEIEKVVLPLQFWLTPEEIISLGMGDDIDKNILLCSMLVALGNPSAKVLIHIKDSSRKTSVYYEYVGKTYVLDNEDDVKSFNSTQDMLDSMSIDDDSTVYEFNDRTYRDIA